MLSNMWNAKLFNDFFNLLKKRLLIGSLHKCWAVGFCAL